MLTVQCGAIGAQVGPSKIRVYGLGEWFVPCVWNDEACHKAMAAEVGRHSFTVSPLYRPQAARHATHQPCCHGV